MVPSASDSLSTLRVAIVHYWLVTRRGGERVVEAMCDAFPQADVFTNVYDQAKCGPTLRSHTVRTTFIDHLPFAAAALDKYLPLMPLALEQLDLQSYDVVISSESGPAKGIVTAPGALHVCYCHSPMRYVWDFYNRYVSDAGWLTRLAMRPAAHYLRHWDYVSAQRPDTVFANSEHTRRRIAKYWRRESSVIYPPVDLARFRHASATVAPGNYFLCAGQLMPYKRVDLAVDAFAKLGLPLVVAGDGPAFRSLRRRATGNVQFVGYKSDQQLAELVAGCRALVFPGEEDFGIVPIEAMAAGRPCIAFNRGGAIESIEDGGTGILFDEQESAVLCDAVARFISVEKGFDSSAISASVERFSRERFVREFRSNVLRTLASG